MELGDAQVQRRKCKKKKRRRCKKPKKQSYGHKEQSYTKEEVNLHDNLLTI